MTRSLGRYSDSASPSAMRRSSARRNGCGGYDMVKPPARFIMLCAVMLLWQTQRPAPQSLPLPDPEPFFAAVRENMARSQSQQNRFAYKERRTELRVNPFGRIGTGATMVYDVMPAADG